MLPPLRGNELVIVPEAILEELDAFDSIGWSSVAAHLGALPISGVVSDHPGLLSGIDGVIVFESLTAIGADLELELNRELTERRSRLYQLGSDLARMFSSASIGGSDLGSFLKLAERRTEIPVALMTSTGRVLAASRDGLDPTGLAIEEHFDARRITLGGYDWMSRPVTGVGLPAGVYLVAAILPEEPGDRARLVLEQTGEVLGLIFDQFPPVSMPAPRHEASRILSDLATSGSLPSAARRRLNQLGAGVNLDGQLRLLVNLAQTGKAPSSDLLSFQADDVWLSIVDDGHYRRVADTGQGRYVFSRPFSGIERLPAAVKPVLTAYRLSSAGLLAGGRIDLGVPGSGGALAALLGLASADGEIHPHLTAFADVMLGAVESYDQARDMRLVETLGAYLDSGAVVASAAARLGVHRNTLSYRIARIVEVSGFDLADPAVRFDLQLAVAIRRLQTV
ncbi:PucR family transcriptional regulator [soil metagenome]